MVEVVVGEAAGSGRCSGGNMHKGTIFQDVHIPSEYDIVQTRMLCECHNNAFIYIRPSPMGWNLFWRFGYLTYSMIEYFFCAKLQSFVRAIAESKLKVCLHACGSRSVIPGYLLHKGQNKHNFPVISRTETDDFHWSAFLQARSMLTHKRARARALFRTFTTMLLPKSL